jgi:arylsulfatase A-like enzyme
MLLALPALPLASCGGPPPRSDAPQAIRLVAQFSPERVEQRVPMPAAPARTEIRFDAAPAAFVAGPGVADLAVVDGKLTGRTTTGEPKLRLSLPQDAGRGDLVHAIELRMRASAGRNAALEVRAAPGAGADDPFARTPMLWPIGGPIVPGEALRTYRLEPQFPIGADAVREIYLEPTDAAGASFAIESVRVVFDKERLAGVPSGPGWQGLSEIYRETLVARVPETLRFRIDVPPAAWLDLALGSPEEEPIRFRVLARAGGEETALLERTVTARARWEPARVDLSRFAGKSVELALSLGAERSGTIGFWGAPVVRSAAPRTGPQGVVVILADTLRSDHLDAYGYGRATAPRLHRMAQEGTLFRDAVSQASWTKVSMSSNLLSLYPSSHRIRSFSDRLPDEAHTLAEAFRDAGFATLSLSANFFVGKLTHLEQGFEEFHESASLPQAESAKTARAQVDRLLPWLDMHRDVPFFVYLHVTDPHSPYRPTAPYDTRFASAEENARHAEEQTKVRGFIAHPLMRAFGMPLASELAASGIAREGYLAVDRAWYDGSIRAMDEEIARVFERLAELGLSERTLVVFASDHGEEFQEHGASFHGRTVYGEVTRVPLVFWGAGIPAGRNVDETVESIDVMPTLLELAGVPAEGPMQGRSLAPLLAPDRPGSWPARPAISEHRMDLGGPPWTDREGTAIEAEGWKLIENASPGADRPALELYDARGDRLDAHDVAAAHPDVVERLRAQLSAWRAETGKVQLSTVTAGEAAMSSEEIERLKSLGYVQ